MTCTRHGWTGAGCAACHAESLGATRAIARQLLAWHDEIGRQALTWRDEGGLPCPVLLIEIGDRLAALVEANPWLLAPEAPDAAL